MGFQISIELDHSAEYVPPPFGGPSFGKAAFGFITGLQNYCFIQNRNDVGASHIDHVMQWYEQLDQQMDRTLCTVCRPLLDCIWSSGGDSTEYGEADYELFLEKTSGSGLPLISQEQFIDWVRYSRECWRPIELVSAGAKALLDAFQRLTLLPLEGFYDAQYTILDFEWLYANLEAFAQRGHHVVRLNVM